MKYELEQNYATMEAQEGSEYHLEINKASWDNRKGKFEIRRVRNSDGKPLKGLPLTLEELEWVKDVLPEILDTIWFH